MTLRSISSAIMILFALTTVFCEEEAPNGLIPDANRGMMVGGFMEQPKKMCYEAIQKGYKDSLKYFLGHRLKGCKTQVVAGLNFEITLKNETSDIPLCTFVVYRDLSNNFSLNEESDEELDCIRLYRAKDKSD